MAWKTTESNYTQGERWFILYDYLRRNSRKGHPVSRKQIFDYLSANYDITSARTPSMPTWKSSPMMLLAFTSN